MVAACLDMFEGGLHHHHQLIAYHLEEHSYLVPETLPRCIKAVTGGIWRPSILQIHFKLGVDSPSTEVACGYKTILILNETIRQFDISTQDQK